MTGKPGSLTSEARYQVIVEAAHQGIAIIAADLRVCFANASLERMLGYRLDEAIGEPLTTFFFPEDLARASELQSHRVGGVSEHFEMRLRRRDGTAIWALIAAAPVPDEQGGTQSLMMVLDITDQKRAAAGLQESEARFRGYFENAAVGIALADLDGTLVEANVAYCRLTGRPERELLGTRFYAFTEAEDAAREKALVDQLLKAEIASFDMDKRYLHPDGQVIYAHVSVSLVHDEAGRPRYLAGVCQDVTSEVALTKRLRVSEERLHLLAENAQDVIFRYRIGPGEGFEYANAALGRLYGYRLEDLAASSDSLVELVGAEQAAQIRATFGTGQDKAEPLRLAIHHRDGHIVWSEASFNFVHDDAGAVVAVEGIVRDVSGRKAIEDQLVHQALHDPLTGLANRSLLVDRIDHALRRQRRHGAVVAVLFLDLDNFKLINDSHGHGAGDETLRAVADRLTEAVRPGDSVARLGGDEFVVVCEEVSDPGEAMTIAERIHKAIAAPIHLGEAEVSLSTSIGIATATTGGIEDLLASADAAMYRAKALGGCRSELIGPGL